MRSTNQRLECDNVVLTQKLNDAKQEIKSLKETIMEITTEKEVLLSQIGFEAKIRDHAVILC